MKTSKEGMKLIEQSYVYLHVKATTGEPFYVGKGGGISKKSNDRYFSNLNRSKHWHNIVNKHGFDIIFLDKNLTEQEAFEKEIYWIKRIGRKDLGLGSLVNFTDGGEGTCGRIVTQETKDKMSKAAIGKKHTDEAKDKMSKSKKGIKLNINTKLKMAIAHTGKQLSDKTKNKIGEKNKKIFKVIQLDLNNNIIKIWDNHHLAAIDVNGEPVYITRVCYGHRNTYKNYKWKFYE